VKISDKYSRGLSVIELVVASAIVSLFIGALALSLSAFLRLSSANLENVKGTFLAEEGIEAVKFLRNADWQNISSLNTGSSYYLNFTGSSWEIVNNETLIDGLFSRRLVFENVFRDSNGEIVQNGGTLDAGSRKLSVTVSWLSGGATTFKSISTYITDI
jgi:hypothetical protein